MSSVALLSEDLQPLPPKTAPGAMVVKNTVVTTKPGPVPVMRVPAAQRRRPGADAGARRSPGGRTARRVRWGRPSEVPKPVLSAICYRLRQQLRLQQGAGGALRRARPLYGYTNELVTLNELAGSPRTRPALAARDDDLDLTRPRRRTPSRSRRSSIQRVRDGAGATPVPPLGPRKQPVERLPRLPALRPSKLADSARRHSPGSPTVTSVAGWEAHGEWNTRAWPMIMELRCAQETQAAAHGSRRRGRPGGVDPRGLEHAMAISARTADTIHGGRSDDPTNTVRLTTIEVRAEPVESPTRNRRRSGRDTSRYRCRRAFATGPATTSKSAEERHEEHVQRLARRLRAASRALRRPPR